MHEENMVVVVFIHQTPMVWGMAIEFVQPSLSYRKSRFLAYIPG
ncbi:hypothetical protein THF5H11_200033 [Vibrio jasicida]|nr:hypothetical protein THF5H11_200033 [Vibrio jasicida]